MKKHEIFKSHPQLKEVYMTSDGQAFYNDGDAKLHAKSLEDKKVELVLNPDQLEVVDDEELTEGKETPKVELKKLKKEELIKYAADNGLTLDATLTNPKMVESIEAQEAEKLNAQEGAEGAGAKDDTEE